MITSEYSHPWLHSTYEVNDLHSFAELSELQPFGVRGGRVHVIDEREALADIRVEPVAEVQIQQALSTAEETVLSVRQLQQALERVLRRLKHDHGAIKAVRLVVSGDKSGGRLVDLLSNYQLGELVRPRRSRWFRKSRRSRRSR